MFPICEMGTRVPTSQGYHKELLKFYIAKYHARLKRNIQNLFSFPAFSPISSFIFPHFLFPGLCSCMLSQWHQNHLLTNRASPTPSEIASVCFSHPPPPPSTKLYHWKSQRDGPQSGPPVSSELKNETWGDYGYMET